VGTDTRPRSCIACARVKAGCDKRHPECSRCGTRAIECRYPAKSTRSTRLSTYHADDMLNELEKMKPSSVADSSNVRNSQHTGTNSMILGSTLVMPGSDFEDFEGEYLNLDDTEVGFPDVLNASMDEPDLSPDSSSLTRPSTPLSNTSVWISHNLISPSLSIPRAPSYTARSLSLKPTIPAGAQRVANLIFHNLKSYPRMILRHNSLPPFIHPSLVAGEFQDINVELLTNAISLMQMIGNGIQGSRKLFWKNVRLECERLIEEVSHSFWLLRKLPH
jgi:hypothetical protein